MRWQPVFLWLIAAGMIFYGAGACCGKPVPQNEATNRDACGSKLVLDEKVLNDTALKNEPPEGKSGEAENPLQPDNLQEPAVSGDASSGQSIVPGAILEAPARFKDRAVTVTGLFQGWRGPCRNGPPVSRGDWMIADPSGCLYVHGPIPPGLDPAKPSGEKISVAGVVRVKNGQPYLEMQ